MTDDKALNAKAFFSLGIAFAEFSEKPDREKYELIYQGASSLKLEVPSYDELLAERLYWGVVPPKKWFEGSEGKSLRNYFRIGTLFYSILLAFLENKIINSNSVQELRISFRAESLPMEILENYLKDLMTGDFSGSYSRFKDNFCKKIDERYIESKNYYDKAREFFDLGTCFTFFWLVPNRDKYECIYEWASSLNLKVPDYDELLAKQDYWILPEKWFKGSEGKSLRNYFQIGILSGELLVSVSLEKKEEIYSHIGEKLRILFRAESLPMKILENWLTDLKTGHIDMSFTRFIHNFYKAIGKKDTEMINTEDRLKFNLREPVPSFFKEEVLDDIKRILEEASVCYKNQVYSSAIQNCGKVIEILIKNVYKPVTKKETYTIKNERKIARTFKQMCEHLRAKGMLLSKGVGELLDLIYAHRNDAAHERRKPSKEEAYSIGLLTNDAMNCIFEYFNTHSQS